MIVGYFASLGVLAWWCARRNRSAEEFTAAGGSLPGWLCGMSIFATYLSSISYLALPGKAFADNWNPLVFSIALLPAGWIATKYFVPMYRASDDVSAYAWFERRFGLWARLVASVFYLLFQIARVGLVMYLMALPLTLLFGWDIRLVLLATGVAVTAYSFVGGIVAVIYADAIQAVILLAGALFALALILGGLPEGMVSTLSAKADEGKLSLGSFDFTDWRSPTVWVVLVYGLMENLRNFGVDQSYVQRYIAAKDEGQARGGVWLSVWAYIPVSALFLLIGTSLYAYYSVHPESTEDLRRLVAEERGIEIESVQTDQLADRVFPHFIANALPVGIRGLLIAAIFAAAMSTVSTSLNSSATLVLSDFYQRLYRPNPPPESAMRVLRSATIAWGAMGTAMSLVLVRVTAKALDIWWTLSGVLGAALVGMFLLGRLHPGLYRLRAVVPILVGLVAIAWMTVTSLPTIAEALRARQLGWLAFSLNPFLIIAIGPAVMLLAGVFARMIRVTESTKPHRP